MNKNGYAVKELILLCGILAVFFAVAIVRVSFAFEAASDEERVSEVKNNALLIAAEYYVKKNPEKFKTGENFLYGSDLIEAGFLTDIEDFDYKNVKIKVVYQEEAGTYQVQVVE